MPESLEPLRREFRLAIRGLARARTFTIAAILTLALGIGAVTLTFDLLHGTLLRPLPFPDSRSLLLVQSIEREPSGAVGARRWSPPWFERLREATGSADLAAYNRASVNLSGEGIPEHVGIEVVSGNYFRVLRTGAALGRTFLADRSGSGEVVLGHGVWVRRWAGASDIVGRSIRANGVPLVVIGVMPAGFAGVGGRADLWVTHQTATAVTFEDRLTTGERFLTLVARPAGGITRDRLEAQLSAATAAMAAQLPEEDATPGSAWSARVTPLEEARIAPARRRATLLLFGAVWFVLAIVCMNVAALQLVRAEGRAREFAIRMAIGGSRARIARLVLIESAVIALCGGVIGALLATRGAALVVRLAPQTLPAPGNDYGAVAEFMRAGNSGAVLLFAIVVTGLTALGFGLAPALRAGRPGSVSAIRTRSDRGLDGGHRSALATLAATQITLGLVLLTGAALFIDALARNLRVETGATTRDLITFWVNPPDPAFSTRDEGRTGRILDAVRAVPGVMSATVSRCAPLMPTCSRAPLWIDRTDARDPPIAGRHYVAEAHFATLAIPLLRGRAFTRADDADAPRVAIVSENAARLWPGGDPIGRTLRFAPPDDTSAADWEVVGVAGDVRYWPPDAQPGIDVYTPYRQHSFPSVLVIARIAVPPPKVIPALREAVADIDPDLPIHDVRSLEQRAREAFAGRTFQTVFLASFALVALVLATLGAWGLARASVERRTGEFGVRLALGASLLRMILAENLRISLAGIAAGATLAFICARWLRAALEDIGTTRLLPLAIAAALLLLASLAASARPALRAGRTDPLVSIRSE
ncbi:MAG: ADOP family duplicated permease [Gemmatimonadetes bacterium]|nr:ADOP family duplicated permease [Gemmatimonadota bacterium]